MQLAAICRRSRQGRQLSNPPAPSSSFTTSRAASPISWKSTRGLQVEHPVTEGVFGIDLVEWMIRQAAGEFELPSQSIAEASRAMRSKCGFMRRILRRTSAPPTGRITEFAASRARPASTPGSKRGTEVSPNYDPLLAKIIVMARHASRRDCASLDHALDAAARFGASRPISPISAISRAATSSPRAMPLTSTLKDLTILPRVRSKCWRPAHNRACRIGRAASALGCRRAALRADGRALAPARQPHSRQSQTTPRRSNAR